MLFVWFPMLPLPQTSIGDEKLAERSAINRFVSFIPNLYSLLSGNILLIEHIQL